MNFSEGQVVVHPHHGPATVTAITTRVVRAEQRRYLKLQVLGSDLVVGVPLESAEEVGVRPVLGDRTPEEVFAVLTAPTGHEESGWSRRIKADVDRLRSGDLLVIAGLVRDLTRRQEDKGISLGEKDVLRDARRPFVAEIAIALGLDDDEADAAVDAAVLDGTIPRLPERELAVAG